MGKHEITLSDFLFYLIYDTNLNLRDVKEDKDGNWCIEDMDSFISAVKALKVAYTDENNKISAVYNKLTIYVDVYHKEDRDYFFDVMNWLR